MQNYRRIELKTQAGTVDKYPLVCTPLIGRSAAELMAELDIVLPKKPDVLEWRVDYFAAIGDTAQVIATARAIKQRAGALALLGTRRSASEGGQAINLSEDQVLDMYCALCQSKTIELIDYEMANPASNVAQVRAAAQANQVKLVLSFHDFSATPSLAELTAKFQLAEQLGADVAKIAVMARHIDDVLTLLAATRQASQQRSIALISVAMGHYGALTRLVGAAFGSALTFALATHASAPGQLPIEDVQTVLRILQKSMPAK